MYRFDSMWKEATAQDAMKAIWEITECLHNAGTHISDGLILIVAYLLHEAKQTADLNALSLNNPTIGNIITDDAVRCIVQKELNEDIWIRLSPVVAKYDAEVFRYIVLMPNGLNVGSSNRGDEMATPESITRLANAVLSIKPGSLVADIGCGAGSYLTSTAIEQPEAEYYGYEINTISKVLASIRARLLDGNIRITQCDAFSLAVENGSTMISKKKFDCIFANYPFAMRIRNFANNPGAQRLINQYPSLLKASSADWLFHALISSLLADKGKAVCITTNGSTWNTTDVEVRKQFVEEGCIEAVIALPEKLFSYTSTQTSMIILSHGNTSVKLVDATSIYTKGRRVNTFDANQLDTIMDALLADSKISKTVPIDEIRKNEYVLNPGRYMGNMVAFKDGVVFEDIIKSISRGAPYTAHELDEIVSHTVTDTQYLMLANIQNGIIENNLPYLKEIDAKYEKYCVHTGTLILSKNGLPYKIAVARVEKGKRILANGNLYIIDLDEDKADPYYVKAFLESEQGIAQLNSITVGATLPNIGVEKLRKIMIPLPSMDTQRRIAAAYLAAQDEVSVLKRKLEKAQSRLTHVFDVESEDRLC